MTPCDFDNYGCLQTHFLHADGGNDDELRDVLLRERKTRLVKDENRESQKSFIGTKTTKKYASG